MLTVAPTGSHVIYKKQYQLTTLHWRHNDRDGVSNHQPHGCLLNRLFRRKSKKTSKLRVTGLCVGNSPGPVNFPHKGPVTRKMFPFDDVIMETEQVQLCYPTMASWHKLTSHLLIPSQWISCMWICCFLCCLPEQAVKQRQSIHSIICLNELQTVRSRSQFTYKLSLILLWK